MVTLMTEKLKVEGLMVRNLFNSRKFQITWQKQHKKNFVVFCGFYGFLWFFVVLWFLWFFVVFMVFCGFLWLHIASTLSSTMLSASSIRGIHFGLQ
jgi:uncharacterized membrane protein